eukprot:g14957.t1
MKEFVRFVVGTLMHDVFLSDLLRAAEGVNRARQQAVMPSQEQPGNTNISTDFYVDDDYQPKGLGRLYYEAISRLCVIVRNGGLAGYREPGDLNKD